MGQTDKQAVTVQPHNRIRWVTSYTQEYKYTKIQPKNMQEYEKSFYVLEEKAGAAEWWCLDDSKK